MTHRHLTSRKVVLTAAFLALAAGGTAACDASNPDGVDGFVTGPGDTTAPTVAPTVPATTRPTATRTSRPAVAATATAPRVVDTPPPVVEPQPVDESVDESVGDEVFYCADTDGQIVDEEYCDDDPDGNTYLFWHSAYYQRGLTTGSYLEDGDQFASGDRESRRAFKLPTSGKISNGTIKTNVVGRGSVTSGFDSSAGG